MQLNLYDGYRLTYPSENGSYKNDNGKGCGQTSELPIAMVKGIRQIQI